MVSINPNVEASRNSHGVNVLRLSGTLVIMLILGVACLSPQSARAQIGGTITITDLDNGPITATEVGGPGNVNKDLTADPQTPEMIGDNIDIDGNVGNGGTGYAVLKEYNSNEVSDLLTVTTMPRGLRGNGPYYNAAWTFLSDTDPQSIDLSTLGLDQTAIDAILAAGQQETGKPQEMNFTLVDSSGNAFSVPNLSIMAASALETPEPSGLIVFGLGSLLLTFAGLRMRKSRATC